MLFNFEGSVLLIPQASVGELFGKRHDKAHAHAAHAHLHSAHNVVTLCGHVGSPFLAIIRLTRIVAYHITAETFCQQLCEFFSRELVICAAIV